jgi:hypothetical protein
MGGTFPSMRGYAAIAMVLIMSHHSKRLIIMDSVVSNCFYFIFSPPITALADLQKQTMRALAASLEMFD